MFFSTGYFSQTYLVLPDLRVHHGDGHGNVYPLDAGSEVAQEFRGFLTLFGRYVATEWFAS